MINPSVSLADAVAYLNDLLALDQQAVEHLVQRHSFCNSAMADRIQAEKHTLPPGFPPSYSVGLLGVLNGLFGIQGPDDASPGSGAIAAVYRSGELVEFCLTEGV